jgi:hypothetical protein
MNASRPEGFRAWGNSVAWMGSKEILRIWPDRSCVHLASGRRVHRL